MIWLVSQIKIMYLLHYQDYSLATASPECMNLISVSQQNHKLPVFSFLSSIPCRTLADKLPVAQNIIRE
jgi:hypothetical protein